MTTGDSFCKKKKKKKKIECFPLAFPQLTWAYWQHDSFLVKKENEWFSNYLAFNDSTWIISKECLRVTMEKWKNGRASHHSPIRLNSQTRRISILRVTAGFFVLFCFVLFCFVLYCFVLYCIVLYCILLCCVVLCCVVLCCVVLCCVVLYCFVLFCIVLFCFVLYCFVLFFLSLVEKPHFNIYWESPGGVEYQRR